MTLIRFRPIQVIFVLVVVLALGGCEPSPEQTEADQEGVRLAIGTYLPLLSQAYETGNLEPMRDVTAEKEIAMIAKLVSDYAERGVVISATLQELTIEDITIWNANNAYASTLEVWDLRKYVAGTEQLLSEALDQPHRVKYQLQRRDEGWQVLYRQAQAVE